MKKNVARIYEKSKSRTKNKYLFLILFIILVGIAIYFGAFSKASIVKEITYKDYFTSNEYVTSIEVSSDSKGEYVILADNINNKEVFKYYLKNSDESKTEYLPGDKCYVGANGLNFEVEYVELLETNATVVKVEDVKYKEIYLGECGQEAQLGTESDPYKTLEKLNNETNNITEDKVRVIIKGTATLNSWFSINKEIELVGYDKDSKVIITGNWLLLNKTVIKNLNIQSNSENLGIYANGNELILGEKNKKDDLKINTSNDLWYPFVYGGSNSSDLTKNTNITVNSGTYRSIYGGSNSKKITGNTNLVINYATVKNVCCGGSYNAEIIGDTNITINNGYYLNVYGGSYNGKITGNTNLTINNGNILNSAFGGNNQNIITKISTLNINGGIYGKDNKSERNIAISAGSYNGRINTDTVLNLKDATIINGCITGAGYSTTVDKDIKLNINNIKLKEDGTGISSIYGMAGDNPGTQAGTKNIYINIDTIIGTPKYIMGFSDAATGSQMPDNSTINLNINNINSSNTEIYGGSLKGNQTYYSIINMEVKNTNAKFISAGGDGTVWTYKIKKYNVTINENCNFSSGVYLGVYTNLYENVTTDGNTFIANNFGTNDLPQKVYIRQKTATVTLNNSNIDIQNTFIKSNLELNNSKTTILGLAGNLNNIDIDENSEIIFTTSKNFKIEGTILGSGTITLPDTALMYINGNIENKIKIDIIENNGTQDHYINILATTKQNPASLYFNTDKTDYKTDINEASNITYWKFYTINGIKSVENVVYLDNVNGDNNNDGTIFSPIKNIKRASEIINNNSSKNRVVIISDLDLKLEEEQNIDTTDIYTLITSNDGIINYGKSVVLSGTTNSIYQNLKFENITIRSNSGTQNLYANGNKLVMGNNIATSGNIALYGGSYSKDIDDTYIDIYSGTWYQVFGASNTKSVKNVNLTVYGGSISYLYGGSLSGTVTDNINVTIKNGSISYLYGGANNATVNANIYNVIDNGSITNFYGGSNNGVLNGNVSTVINYGIVGNVYCAGNAGTVNGNVTTNINNGTISNFYGGSYTAKITGIVTSVINTVNLTNSFYGGSYNSVIENNINTTINGGTFNAIIIGGSNLGTINGKITTRITKGSFSKNVFGGSNNSTTNGEIELIIEGGTYSANIYGGNNTGTSKNIKSSIKNITFNNSTNIYGGTENSTINGNIQIELENLIFKNTCNIYGGSNKGSIVGDIVLGIKNITFNNTSNIYRGCNSASLKLVNGITSNFENIKYETTANSLIYGGSNTGTITGNVDFTLSENIFNNNECLATVYGGSNTGTITGDLNFNANKITFKNHLIAGSREGEVKGETTTNIDNCVINGNTYLTKYTAKNITNTINTNIRNLECGNIYICDTFNNLGANVNILLDNIKNNSSNSLKILPSNSTDNINMSDYLNLTINNCKDTQTTSSIDFSKILNIHSLNINNTDVLMEKEFTTVNLEVKNSSKIDFEKNVLVSGNYSGEEGSNLGNLSVYNGMEIKGTITGKTNLEIGRITGTKNNNDSSFLGNNISIQETDTNKIWKVGYLDEFNVIYLDGINGDDNNDGTTKEKALKTLKMAYLFSKDTENPATIVVCGETEIKKWPAATNKKVKITSKYNNEDYRNDNAGILLNCEDTTVSSIILQADTEFEYLNLYTKNSQIIYANGYKLTLGVENDLDSFKVKDYTTKKDTASSLTIYGGTYNKDVDSSELIINSGSYKCVYAGCANSYKVGKELTKGTNVENITINGGTFGDNAKDKSLVLGSTGDTYGGITCELKNATINGYIYSVGFNNTVTYGNVYFNIGEKTNIVNWLFTDGYRARIANANKYTYNLTVNGTIENGKPTTNISSLLIGSLDKNLSSYQYNIDIGNTTVNSIYYGSINNSGVTDTIKGPVYLNINNGAKITNIYSGRYINDSTPAGDFYIKINTNENLSTNIYRKSPNNGGISNICKVEFKDKDIKYSGIIQGATEVLIDKSNVEFNSSTFNTNNLNIKNQSNLQLSSSTNTLYFGNITLENNSNFKIKSNVAKIQANGNFVGGGNLYLNNGIIFTITGNATNATTLYCNDEKNYFTNNATIIANKNSNTAAFKNTSGNTLYTQLTVDKTMRIWQIKEFVEDEYIYVDSNGQNYGMGTKEVPVRTLDQAYNVANTRYANNNLLNNFNIILKTNIYSSNEQNILNPGINITITNKKIDNLGKVLENYNTYLMVNTSKFNFNGNTTLENIKLHTEGYKQGSVEFFGNGYNVTFGEGTEVYSLKNKYPVLYGGSENTDIDKTEYTFKVITGKYNMVFGGGKNSNTKSNIKLQIGDTNSNSPNLKIYETDNEDYVGLFGAGRYGNVTGNIILDILGGDFYRIYGAGFSGTVTGNINLNYYKGTTQRLYGGGQSGEVTGNVNIFIGQYDNYVANAVVTGYIRGSGLLSGISGTSNISIANGAIINENVQFACGGYAGNAANTNLTITGGDIKCDIYGGGWGILGDNTKGKANNTQIYIKDTTIPYNIYGGGNYGSTNNTNITLENSTVNNVYGGGNEAEIQQNTNVKITSSTINNSLYGGGKGLKATVKGNSNVLVEGISLIKENVFGGGDSANTGLEGKDNSNIGVYIYGGTINQSVYGGANTAVVYGNTNVYIGKENKIWRNVRVSNIDIKDSIFGGGKSNIAGSENYDFNFNSVTKNADIQIDGNYYNYGENINIKNSVFASGNAAKISGIGNITLNKFGRTDKIQKLLSIQRTTNLNVNNSVISISGTTDRTNELSSLNYTINRVTNFNLLNNSEIYLESGVNLVENLSSLDNNKNNVEINLKEINPNVKNVIYLMQGKNLILTSENKEYGDLNGVIYLRKFMLDSEGNILVDNEFTHDKFDRSCYIQSRHYDENQFKTHSVLDLANTIITPEPEDTTYSQWILKVENEPIYYENLELIASKYTTTSNISVKLNGLSNPNTIFTIKSINPDDNKSLNQTNILLEDGMELVEEEKISNISDKANNSFSLKMSNGLKGWNTRGETTFLYNNDKKTVNGDIQYISDDSNTVPEFNFTLKHSKNITNNANIGKAKICFEIKYYIGEEREIVTKLAYIILDLNEVSKASSIEYYEGAITPGLKYEQFVGEATNITNKSSFTTYFSTYIDNYDENIYGYGKTAYHIIKSNIVFPSGTKIIMIDSSLDTDDYYYYIVTNKDETNSKKIFKFTDFIKMGTYDQKYNSDAIYYKENYINEEFIIQIDFQNTNIKKDIQNGEVFVSLMNSEDNSELLTVNKEIYPMKFNIYTNKDANKETKINKQIFYMYSNEKDKNIKFKVNSIYQYQQINTNTVYDTQYIEYEQAIKFTFYKDDEIIKSTDNSNLIVINNRYTQNENQDYIIIKDADMISNTTNEFDIKFSNIEANTTYQVKVETVALTKGGVEVATISSNLIKLEALNSNYGLKVSLENNSQIINKTTGLTLDNNNILNLRIDYTGQIENPNIRIELNRRDTEKYSYKYNSVDLKNYFTNNFEETNTNEYLIFNNPSETQNIRLTTKENLKPGTYKIKIKVYDNDTYIGEVYKMIIIK